MFRLNVASAALLGLAVLSAAGSATAQQSNAGRGERAFRACAACHSLAPDENMTGPSLAGVFGRKAGTLPSFERYSPALKSSNVTWTGQSLDAWLRDPAQFIPGNHMTFPGIRDAGTRADLIAYLHRATAPGATPSQSAQPGRGRMGRMGGMMGGAVALKDLKEVGPDRQVRAVRLCHDSYFVTTADGKEADFWEPNLRFETDSSGRGPPAGKPVIMPAGMMGDRASVIFAAPEEISATIRQRCE